MNNIKLRMFIYIFIAANAVILLAVYSRPIARAIAPIAEIAVNLFL